MSDLELYKKISSLPEDLKKQASDFIEFLEARSQQRAEKTDTKVGKKRREFGYAKGFFKISSDFDEPLDDFKEYM
jgi:hypothetical protein